jgi:hypothetical protein
MTDTIVRLLSLLNQLDHCSRRVTLNFESNDSTTIGYLNRIGFFDHLSSQVVVLPQRPAVSAATIYKGNNPAVVEIARINPKVRDQSLLSRLTGAIKRACKKRNDVSDLESAAWTIFAELIDNVFSHSQTPLDGFARFRCTPKETA